MFAMQRRAAVTVAQPWEKTLSIQSLRSGGMLSTASGAARRSDRRETAPPARGNIDIEVRIELIKRANFDAFSVLACSSIRLFAWE